ncbi:hypothetical protein NC651_036742 [Populus alba x Populus x berolinensis]|nr:hypothetical protein NC651_036742 [Populus alba x Populus x berolinensis]
MKHRGEAINFSEVKLLTFTFGCLLHVFYLLFCV